MQGAIQLKTSAGDRIQWISHRKKKFRARKGGFKSMNLARSLQKVDEILNKFWNNKIRRSQMVTTRHNVDIFTSLFHLCSERTRKQGNIRKWLRFAKCICGRYKTHVPMAKLPPAPTHPLSGIKYCTLQTSFSELQLQFLTVTASMKLLWPVRM